MSTANGRQPGQLAWPPELRGDVSALPQPDGAEQARTTPDDRERRWDGDTVIRVLAAAVVLAVAAFAAIVSYSHIFELGSHHGQDGTAARLLPLSVDGLIAAASLVMLHAARRKLPVPQLARWMLGLGVAATVAANVEYGMPFGWLAAVVSAWPAVAFVGSVEMAVRFVRDARQDGGGEHDKNDDSTPPPDDDKIPPPPPSDPPKDRQKTPPALAKAAAAIKRYPNLTDAEVAEKAGVSERTVQRARNGKTGSTS